MITHPFELVREAGIMITLPLTGAWNWDLVNRSLTLTWNWDHGNSTIWARTWNWGHYNSPTNSYVELGSWYHTH